MTAVAQIGLFLTVGGTVGCLYDFFQRRWNR